jgi:heterodisulfide reductase subunit C
MVLDPEIEAALDRVLTKVTERCPRPFKHEEMQAAFEQALVEEGFEHPTTADILRAIVRDAVVARWIENGELTDG